MSRVTDRLDNKQIVELAKQQYENQKQTSKFPANIIILPSNGNVYAETSALRNGKMMKTYYLIVVISKKVLYLINFLKH